MQKLAVAAALAISAVPALGADDAMPTETVTVNNNSLSGVWKITMPGSFKSGVFGKTEWGPAVDVFCRVEEFQGALTVHCPGLHKNGTFIDRGTVTIDGSNIRLIWGSKISRFGIVGTLRPASQFEGKFFNEWLGMSSDAPDRSVGEKQFLSEAAPDKGGRSALLTRLLQQSAQGAPTEPVDTSGGLLRFPTPDQLRPLGAIEATTYLGEYANRGDRPYDVYDVEFSDGNLICELRQRGDNTLDGFICG